MLRRDPPACARRRKGLGQEQGLWGMELARLKAAGLDVEQIAAAMKQVRVEPVLTAHPTEAKRLSVLEQHRTLYSLLEERDHAQLTPSKQIALREDVKATLERLWRTGEILARQADAGR